MPRPRLLAKPDGTPKAFLRLSRNREHQVEGKVGKPAARARPSVTAASARRACVRGSAAPSSFADCRPTERRLNPPARSAAKIQAAARAGIDLCRNLGPSRPKTARAASASSHRPRCAPAGSAFPAEVEGVRPAAELRPKAGQFSFDRRHVGVHRFSSARRE